jgi:Na+/H+-dicarboxylate symporter
LSTTARVLIGLALEPAALMLALDPIPDAVRTAGNVTGDLAVTSVVGRHDARFVAPVKRAAPGTAESAT